jgi:hypothetical protein
MSQAKQASKGKRRNKTVSVLGIVGMSLTTADGAAFASVSGSDADMRSQNTTPRQLVTLGEEEMSDVSLGTFYVFDKENAPAAQAGVQVARACGHGCGGRGCGGRGCGGRGCGGRGCGVRGCGGCRGCGVGGCGGCGVGGCGCCLSWGSCRVC